MKTMAEVLEAHQLIHGEWSCTCEQMFYDLRLNGAELGVEHRLHMEAALTAAGYGPVKEAAAGALRDAADHLAKPYTLWHGDGGVKVQVSESPFKFTKLTEWLKERAAAIEAGQ